MKTFYIGEVVCALSTNA